MRTVEQIRSDIASLEAELTTVSGEPLLIWTGRDGALRDCPEDGATLTVEWAIQEHSYCNWYPSTEAARAALLALARENGTTPDKDGWTVDLTRHGCHSSGAYVTRLSRESKTEGGAFPLVTFSEYVPAYGETRIVRTTDPSWSCLIQFDCNGPLKSPDGSCWSDLAYFNINAREGRVCIGTLLGAGSGLPWAFVPWTRLGE